MIIKVLLLVALTGAAVVLVRDRRTALSLLMRRILGLAALSVGAAAVLVPDLVTSVANLVGVGRGTDLVLYLLVVVFVFVTIGQYLRLSEMHDRYVELARSLALHEAECTSATAPPTPADAAGPSALLR